MISAIGRDDDDNGPSRGRREGDCKRLLCLSEQVIEAVPHAETCSHVHCDVHMSPRDDGHMGSGRPVEGDVTGYCGRS